MADTTTTATDKVREREIIWGFTLFQQYFGHITAARERERKKEREMFFKYI